MWCRLGRGPRFFLCLGCSLPGLVDRKYPRFFPLRSHQHTLVQLGVGKDSQPALKPCGTPGRGVGWGQSYMSSWRGGVFPSVFHSPLRRGQSLSHL